MLRVSLNYPKGIPEYLVINPKSPETGGFLESATWTLHFSRVFPEKIDFFSFRENAKIATYELKQTPIKLSEKLIDWFSNKIEETALNLELVSSSYSSQKKVWMTPSIVPCYFILKWCEEEKKEFIKNMDWLYEEGKPVFWSIDGEPKTATIIQYHVSMFLQPSLIRRKEWIDFAEESYRFISTLTNEQKSAINTYCGNHYEMVWNEFNTGIRTVWIEELRVILESAPFVPIGVPLFEGQGQNENDWKEIENNQYLSGEFKPCERRRPTSTSWLPNSALHFIGSETWNQAKYKNLEGALMVGDYVSKGCLIEYTVGEGIRGLFRQLMDKDKCYVLPWECEIILAPFTITSATIQKGVEIPRQGNIRFMNESSPVKCSFIRCQIKGSRANIMRSSKRTKSS